jgi:alcohol dehydrogenase
LKALGTAQVLDRQVFMEQAERHLLRPQWAGGIDTVGGSMLAQLLKGVKYGGSVTACGLAESAHLSVSLFPFILRGINLLGIDCVELPLPLKVSLWNRWAENWLFDQLVSLEQAIVREIDLVAVPDALRRILLSEHTGRYLVRIGV